MTLAAFAPIASPAAPVPRLQALDALRGAAAVTVMLYHYTVHYAQHFAPSERALFTLTRGNLGVDLFFCISGFVISMTLERCANGRDFAVRRFARIYPTYVASLVFTYWAFSHADLPKFHYGWADFAMNFTMVQELFGFSHIDGVYWTLQVELFFYVIVASLHFSGLLRRLHTVCLVWLLLSAGHALVQQTLPGALVQGIGEVLILPKAPLFIIGMVAFGCYRQGRIDRDGLLVVALCVLCQFVNWRLFAGVAAVLSFALLLAAPRVRVGAGWGPILFLGQISFSLYLIHQHFGYMVIREALTHGATLDQGIVAAIVASIAVATVITFAIEKPAQRFIVGRFA